MKGIPEDAILEAESFIQVLEDPSTANLLVFRYRSFQAKVDHTDRCVACRVNIGLEVYHEEGCPAKARERLLNAQLNWKSLEMMARSLLYLTGHENNGRLLLG